MTTGYRESNQISPYTRTGTFYSKAWGGDDSPAGEPHTQDHAYNCTVRDFNYETVSWKPTGYTGPFINNSPLDFGIPGGLSDVWDNNDDLKLIGKLAERVRGSDFNMGNAVGESHQTFTLIANTATRIAKALHYIRDGNFYGAAKALNYNRSRWRPRVHASPGHVLSKAARTNPLTGNVSPIITVGDMADAVLEFQYGWKPLLSDVHDSMGTLSRRIENPLQSSFKAKRKHSTEDYIHKNGLVWFCQTVVEKWIKIKLGSQPSLNTALHMNDPASVAWEVTPWSFVSDWFLPIGDYLQALDFYRNFDIVSHCTSTKKTVKVELRGGDGTSGVGTVMPSHSFQNFIYFNRSLVVPSNISNIPTPVFKSFEKAMSPTHTLNALALLFASTDGIRKSLKF